MQRQARPFDENDDFIAARPVRLGQDRFVVGSIIDKSVLSPHGLRLMYLADKIIAVEPGKLTRPGAEPAPKQAPPKRPPAGGRAKPVVAPDPVEPEDAAEGDGKAPGPQNNAAGGDGAGKPEGPFSVKHKGFGKWFVLDGKGGAVSGPFKEQEAKDALKALVDGSA